MTPRIELTRSSSDGGGWPDVDESLVVEADGTFTLVRTVSSDAVGTWAGALPPDVWSSLSDAAADVVASAGRDGGGAGGADVVRSRPSGVREVVTVGDARLEGRPSDRHRASAWGPLLAAVRPLLESLKTDDDAVAAVRGVLDEATTTVTLAHVGREPVPVRLAGGEVGIDRFGADEGYEDGATATLADVEATAGAGWTTTVALGPAAAVLDGGTTQVRLRFRLGADARDVQLVLVAGAGWSEDDDEVDEDDDDEVDEDVDD